MILAIDLGGTKLQYGVFDHQATIIHTGIVPTESDFVGQLKELVRLQTQKYTNISLVSLGVPGPTTNNIMQGSWPLKCIHNIDFSSELSSTNISLIVRNDLYMAAHHELYAGIGKKQQQFCLVSISTGIGVAVANSGRILDGRLEMGHQILLPNFEPPQQCMGHTNCWASLTSGAAIVGRYGNSRYDTAKDVFAHVLSSDDLADIRKINAQAFGNIITAYDPETIVIMGSIGLHQYEKIVPSSHEIECFTINKPVPPIVKCEAGGDAGMMGAYYAAKAQPPLT